MNNDNGTQLKNICTQLQMFCSQIQNMALQISNINPNFGIQLNNIGIQISYLTNQIFNIGLQISNISSNFQNVGNMFNNQIIDNENMKSFELNKNDFLNEINNELKITILFQKNSKTIANVFISNEKTIEELINSFLKKIGENSDYFQQNYLLFDGSLIKYNDKRKIKELKVNDNSVILVIERNF